MGNETIDQTALRKQLVRAAQARSIITLGSLLVAIGLWGTLPAIAQNGWTIFAAIFGVPGLVAVATTQWVCRRMVRCPTCGGDLWQVGTGHFKPRQIAIKDGVDCCPHCACPFD
jgi:hypothetical protein